MELRHVTRIDSIPSSETYFTEEGFLHDAPIVTSTGIFEYALPDGGVRRELRLPEHVFDKESLESYRGKPVIITHKAGSIDKNNVNKEIVGTILSAGYQDKDNVRCKVVIHDIDRVKKTPYRELSLGYSLDLIEEPGEWNGEPYDAIQTNIRINHLAIVESARAGEQAHLNLDGKKVEIEDIENKEGGNETMDNTKIHGDGYDLTPEELVEAIKMYKASKGGEETPTASENPVEPKTTDAENTVPEAKVPETEPVAEPEVAPPVKEQTSEPMAEPKEEEKYDDNVGALIDAVEKLCAAIKGGNEVCSSSDVDGCGKNDACGKNDGGCKKDSSEDMSQSMNNDSADDLLRQKLEVCRVGDKLHMDGLEKMSVIDGKKAIITKLNPDMRLDGKDSSYINAAYDMAVSRIREKNSVEYQKEQMTANPVVRQDGNENVSMANSARQRMLEREGGR